MKISIVRAITSSVIALLSLVLIMQFVHHASAQVTVASPPTVQQPTVYMCPLHPGLRSKQPGRCPKCNTTLTASAAAGQETPFFACPMHIDVQAVAAGKCTRCGMSLIKMAPPEIGKYRLRLETTPLIPGQRVRMRFLIFHPKTKQQIRDFHILHDMPFHLFVVSQDMADFQHIHPTQQPDGSFVIETVLQKAGQYHIFCENFPVGGTPQDFHRTLITSGFSGPLNQTRLVPDTVLSKSVDGIRFELLLNPSELLANRITALKYHLVDERTGLPVEDLQPYLGAWGHTFILDEQAADNMHAHPAEMIPDNVDRATITGGAEVSFETLFKRPGRYRVWSQFQRRNKVTTVSFTVNVSPLSRIAKWDGSRWSALDDSSINGPNGTVHAVAVSGSDVYIGGNFTKVGGVNAHRIAKWDGRRWSAVGGGLNGDVGSLAVSGSDVYVGGNFSEAGGVSAKNIAKWDGRRWSAVGGGLTGCKNSYCTPVVHAIAVIGEDVYVGGQFTAAGDVLADGIAKWDGRRWSAVGGGVRVGIYDAVVWALTVSGRNVYVGGQFIEAGGESAYNVAKWDGHRWSALGSGIRGGLEKTLALAVSGSDVYVGGNFSEAGGVSAKNIAKWDGRRWSAVGGGVDGEVRALVVSGSNLYVGGNFTRAGELSLSRIAKWDGRGWSTLGGGITSNIVFGMGVNGSNVYCQEKEW